MSLALRPTVIKSHPINKSEKQAKNYPKKRRKEKKVKKKNNPPLVFPPSETGISITEQQPNGYHAVLYNVDPVQCPKWKDVIVRAYYPG